MLRSLLRGFRLLLLLIAAPGVAPAVDPARPNIVIIFADDWGWGDLSVRGATWLDTPNIDRFARAGSPASPTKSPRKAPAK